MDYPGGPNVIRKVLPRERGRQEVRDGEGGVRATHSSVF